MFVVCMSLVSLVLTDEPTGIVRVMRALRVLRLFGRLKSLRKILSALALAIVPVCQVFLILFILLCIGLSLRVDLLMRTRNFKKHFHEFSIDIILRYCKVDEMTS